MFLGKYVENGLSKIIGFKKYTCDLVGRILYQCT